jgi:hypothetical protein
MRYPVRRIGSSDIRGLGVAGSRLQECQTRCRIARHVELWLGVVLGHYSYINSGTNRASQRVFFTELVRDHQSFKMSNLLQMAGLKAR